MKLKKIEIIGFKSFADKIKLEFNQGITAIVGPNGCGKSNIADAFRWVLGEQSAKSMRGGKMIDVIFAGTSTRKPLNFAEVTLTLGDINGQLDIQYEEAAVTRRLHRNGESEYFLNRQPIRLKDLQSLFWDSGIGKDDYAFFEQGEMDHIINSSPLERRYIFEQAAGILRFLHRKKEALRKLEQVDINITRVKDIHNEVEKRIKVLKEQAEKAKTFKENKIKVEQLEKGVFLVRWENLQKKRTDLQNKKNALTQAKEVSIQNYDIQKVELNEAKQHLIVLEKKMRSQSEEVFKARNDKQLKAHDKQSNQERLKEHIAKEKRWRQELETLLEKRKQQQAEREITLKQQKILEAELGGLEAHLKVIREKYHHLENEVNLLRENQQHIQKENLQFLHTEKQLESELKQTSIRLESTQERYQVLTDKKNRSSIQYENLIIQIKDKEQKLQEQSLFIDEQKKLFLEKDKVLLEVTRLLQKHQDQITKFKQEMTEHKARQNVLLRLKADMEGFSEGSKKLIKEAANPKSTLFQKLKGLYEYIIPPKGEEKAFSAAMKLYAQTLVVETNEIFHSVLEFAQKNKIKDFSLLSLEVISKNHLLSSEFSNSLLLDSKDPFIHHFFKTIRRAKDYHEAVTLSFNYPGYDFWIEEGFQLDRHQVLFFTSQSENTVFMRQAELLELELTLKTLQSSLNDLEKDFQNQQTKKMQVYSEKVELDKALRKNEMTLIEVNFALQRFKGDLDNLKKEDRTLDKEVETLSHSLSKLTVNLNELQEKHSVAKTKCGEISTSIAGVNQELEKKIFQLKFEQRALQEKESQFHKLTDEHRKALHSLHVFEVKDLETLQQIARLEQEITQCQEIQEQIHMHGRHHEQTILEADKLLSEITSICNEMDKAVVLHKKHLESLEYKSNELQMQIKKLENEDFQLGSQLSHTDSLQETIEIEIQQRYNLNISQFKSLNIKLEKSLEYTEKEIRLIKNEMEAAGDINMMSIEEFDQHRERHLFLNREMDDINVSKQELIQIIANLDEESRKQFKTTFEKIKTNFKKNFSILFNGGEANLEFTDTSDVLEAGIEIIAKPPGKHMRSIHLMSGGEKCLTAMALLFAIFEVKPSPFCVLDEIDAPLDDSNVERFVNVLKQFIDRCQFIIITHNKRTMAVADVLFGVSMEEKGISKILSMDFTQKKENESQLSLV